MPPWLLEALLSLKIIDVDSQDEDGNTVLHYFVLKNCYSDGTCEEQIRILLDADVNPLIRNNAKKTARQILEDAVEFIDRQFSTNASFSRKRLEDRLEHFGWELFKRDAVLKEFERVLPGEIDLLQALREQLDKIILCIAIAEQQWLANHDE
jgi:hypothetical protein